MDCMGIEPQTAKLILEDELRMYLATRYRLTMRLRILNRVDVDPPQRQALEQELIKLEEVIAQYESELAGLSQLPELQYEQSNHTYTT